MGSTFWNHGAGDLDLAPWTTTHNQHAPLDIHGSVHQPRRASKKEQERRVNSIPVESPFLDFLYPPQALALLHRNGSHPAERWERRNERRLPKGFIQANRGYASKAKNRTRTKQEIAHDRQQAKEAVTAYEWDVTPDVKTQQMDAAATNEQLAQSEIPEHDGEFDNFSSADSPSELAELDEQAEQSAITTEIKTLKELRSLVATPNHVAALEEPERSLKHTEHAWSLFEQLGAKDRADIGIKIKLLEWLSHYRNEAAETHCLELYHAIPTTRRTMAIYMSALPVFIRSNLYGLAEQAHVEALEQLENGHEVSLWLCSTAINNEMWDLASRIKQQLDAKHAGQAKDWVDNIF